MIVVVLSVLLEALLDPYATDRRYWALDWTDLK